MSSFGYSRELKKYEEVEEDELLATLSSEELQELERELADLDPDDNVPIGLRQKDQTTKTPTGTFDRDALLKYWEDDNKTLLEDDKEESNAGQVRRDTTTLLHTKGQYQHILTKLSFNGSIPADSRHAEIQNIRFCRSFVIVKMKYI